MDSTEASPLIGLSHFALHIRDFDASVDWYTKALGLQEISREPGRFVGLRSASGQFRLALLPGGQAENRGALDHIAFLVSDIDALTAWSHHLTAIGITHDEIKPNPVGGHSMDLFDPDGNNIELVSES
jgi:catechol 2,3-dioxygenase-like lactoylglutathione lyase family enzyme